jgi:orotidine-5'-phosphate decarboxylase
MFALPLVRGPHTAAGSDQRYVSGPRQASKAGASILVIGRAITAADDRLKAAYDILEDIATEL